MVIVERVVLEERGYVAIYDSQNGAPSSIIGISNVLDTGEHLNLEVNLETQLPGATDLFAILHAERNGNSTLDHPDGPDEPISSTAGVVAVPIEVVVNGG